MLHKCCQRLARANNEEETDFHVCNKWSSPTATAPTFDTRFRSFYIFIIQESYLNEGVLGPE